MSRGAAPLPVGEDEQRRRERVEEIRRAVEEGKYQVDAALVADAILESLRPGERPPG